ncbi:hypothetical protein [Streptomyces sp. IBSBF 2435]
MVTEQTVRGIFGVDSRVVTDEVSGAPPVLPIGRHHVRAAAARRSRAV